MVYGGAERYVKTFLSMPMFYNTMSRLIYNHFMFLIFIEDR